MDPILILMRHGQSAWNEANLFTGWVDVPLSEKGIEEAVQGGKKIQHLPIDIIFTSTLIRAQMTLVLVMNQHQSRKVPVFLHPHEGKLETWGEIYSAEAKKRVVFVHKAWELNERMYGELQGLNKAETAKQYGEEQVQIWRRSYDVAPPKGESLAMTGARTIPYFQKNIISQLNQGKNVFVSAHGNSLRSILMHIGGLSKEEVVKLELATGEPIVYKYKQGIWQRDLSR
ncbi:MAG: 2,3-bisphosphoglycerate-dependent phosphoglycerate mutase [Chlamydiae bacterium]|nr:2,3-bisphosphoglycerate-dependent phosphoglycerate mutase [Chlamydiota bacterium]